MKTRIGKKTLVLATTIFLLILAQTSWAQTTTGPYLFNGLGWDILDDPHGPIPVGYGEPIPGTPPIPIYADKDHPWIKLLEMQPGPAPLPQGATFNLLEHIINAGPSPANPGSPPFFTDWHEEILTPGWAWDWGDVIILDPSGMPIGPPVMGMITGDLMNFYFPNPVMPGMELSFLKILKWTGVDESGNPLVWTGGIIEVAQYPTVPIPGAAWLLGVGLIGLMGIRRKKDR